VAEEDEFSAREIKQSAVCPLAATAAELCMKPLGIVRLVLFAQAETRRCGRLRVLDGEYKARLGGNPKGPLHLGGMRRQFEGVGQIHLAAQQRDRIDALSSRTHRRLMPLA